MKNLILNKIDTAIRACGVEETAEEMYRELKVCDKKTFQMLSQCFNLDYDQENYVLFSDGKDKYVTKTLKKQIKNALESDVITEMEVRKCHFIFNYLLIWDHWEIQGDVFQEAICDCELCICDALTYIRNRHEYKAYCQLNSALEILEDIQSLKHKGIIK